MEYKVPTFNKFESSLLDSDQDPFDILAAEKEKNLTAKKDSATKTGSAKTTQNQKKPVKKQTDTVQEKKPTTTRAPSGGPRRDNRNNAKSAEKRTNADNTEPRTESKFQQDTHHEPKRSDNESMGQGRTGFPRGDRGDRDGPRRGERSDRGRGGRGRGRGGRGGGRGGHTGGSSFDDENSSGGGGNFKRDFDRHSGSDRTGVKPIEKRDGFGSHNWGTIEDDVEGQLNDSNVSEENNQQIANIENLDPNKSTENAEEPKEEDVLELTLDEWKAKQKEENKPKADFNIRRANEGADQKQWKNTYVLKKKIDTDSEQEEEEEEIERKQLKASVPIEITFADSRRGGRGAGGRGGRGRPFGDSRGGRGFGDSRPRGGRGGGGGGGGGYNKRQDVPKPDDKEAFPDLPGKA